jgi:hypothetical protein
MLEVLEKFITQVAIYSRIVKLTAKNHYAEAILLIA